MNIYSYNEQLFKILTDYSFFCKSLTTSEGRWGIFKKNNLLFFKWFKVEALYLTLFDQIGKTV